LTKELNLALTKGFRVTALGFTLGNWGDTASMGIRKQLENDHRDNFKWIELDATPSHWFGWFLWGLSEKLARKIYPFFKNNIFINALANTRRAVQLVRAANRSGFRPDLIIAHNMGTLYPAYRLGKIRNIPFIFDIEDYHPGESVSKDKDNEKKRREFLLRKLLPIAKAITSASPLIEKYTLNLIGGHPNHKVILNSFPDSEFSSPIIQKSNQEEPLKLTWFGQKIGPGRGLEQLFRALADLSKLDLAPIYLTLIGDWDPKFKNDVFLPLQKTIDNTSFMVQTWEPIPQRELHLQLGHYDIGLAMELIGTDLNRQLCLTNKIMAYAQAGLYILATDTGAQSRFINQDPNRGVLCGQSSSEIHQALEKIIKNREAIISGKGDRYKNGRKLCWEQAATKLSGLWNDVIKG